MLFAILCQFIFVSRSGNLGIPISALGIVEQWPHVLLAVSGSGATLLIVHDAKIDQTSQGVRAAGKFDESYILFAGGTVRYVF